MPKPLSRAPRNAQERAGLNTPYEVISACVEAEISAEARVFRPEGFQDDSKEVEIATRVAEAMQIDVFLAPRVEQKGLNLVDAWIQGEAWEFKRVTPEARNWRNAVKQRLSDGKKQASRIVVYLDNDRYSGVEADRLINAGIQSALYWDRKQQQIGLVAILTRWGGYQAYTRQELLSDEALFGLFSGRD